MNALDARETTRPNKSSPGWALVLTILALLPALADCTDVESATTTAEAVAVEPRPGCPKEFPVQFQGISCAGYDYDPPPIPFGETYPPR